MRDGWYRDPRIALIPATLTALAEAVAVAAAGEPVWRVLLLAAAAFALVAWGWFAIQGLGWLWQRPDRREVLRALSLQRSQHGFNQAAWTRFDRDAAMLRMVMAERALTPIEAELVRHAAEVEKFDAVAQALPGFSQAAAHWYDIASQGHAGLPGATPVPTPAALEEAATHLPPRDWREEDRRAALHYLAVRKRLMADRATIERERAAALRKLTAPPPSVPA
ncbi:hypothetical protein [Sphingomonas sp. VNH70]|uniref:hypothetical protein n=1 Tax=Sphingomonas silueang TaxID=3156617 RepID=UPI0032B3A867